MNANAWRIRLIVRTTQVGVIGGALWGALVALVAFHYTSVPVGAMVGLLFGTFVSIPTGSLLSALPRRLAFHRYSAPTLGALLTASAGYLVLARVLREPHALLHLGVALLFLLSTTLTATAFSFAVRSLRRAG
ncbi:hypothetical protein GCM10009639_60200 [Kitasatospora putterlickiae]|uniref:Uncharacterized protein n=1 Tax=Kitasatospora putterlickiae TaxID=221725 RepID=A0ABN1YFD2_9ACTN